MLPFQNFPIKSPLWVRVVLSSIPRLLTSLNIRAYSSLANCGGGLCRNFIGASECERSGRRPLRESAGAKLGGVTPFALARADEFRTSPPPQLASDEYARMFNEVRVWECSTARLVPQSGLCWEVLEMATFRTSGTRSRRRPLHGTT